VLSASLLGAIGVALVALVYVATAYVRAADISSYVLVALVHGGVYLAGVIVVLRRDVGLAGLIAVLVFAVLLRVIAITAPPNLTTDAFRYIWDGRIQLGGINPYLYVPADPALAAFRDEAIYPLINKKETAHTIYPPMSQIIFMMGAAIQDGLAGQKAMMLAFEAITVAALIGWLRGAGLPPARVLIYAWHPLPIWEFASQAHIDAAATAFIAVGVWAAYSQRQGLLGAMFACAALVKYFPVVLLPALWRRWDWRAPTIFVAVCLALYAPYIGEAGTRVIGFLGKHLDNEGYGAGWGFHLVWFLRDFKIADPPVALYLAFALVCLFALAAWAFFMRGRDEMKPEALALLGAAFVFFTSPHYPWYFAFLVALMVRVPHPALFAMTIFSIVLQYPRPPGGATWTELYALAYWLPLVIWLAMLAWRHRASVTQWR